MTNGRVKQWSSIVLALGLLACAPLVQADFGSGAIAGDWCKEKTLNYLKKRGYIPYNWVAATRSDGDDYITEGEWSVDADDIKVQCTTPKNAASGRYKILGIDVSDGIETKSHFKNQ